MTCLFYMRRYRLVFLWGTFQARREADCFLPVHVPVRECVVRVGLEFPVTWNGKFIFIYWLGVGQVY